MFTDEEPAALLYLNGRDLCLIAIAHRRHISNSAFSHQNEAVADTSSVVQRKDVWLLQLIRHATGIYGLFAGLAQAARQQSEQALSWWESCAT